MKKKIGKLGIVFALLLMMGYVNIPVNATEPELPLTVTLTSDMTNVYIGATVTYTSNIINTSEFTIRDVLIKYPINGEYLDIQTTQKDGVTIPNSTTPESIANVQLGDIKPNQIITIVFSAIVNDNASLLLEQGLPIRVTYDYDYPDITFDASASSIVSYNDLREYGINDTFTEQVTISNNNLDQITNWNIAGTLPAGLIVTRIYDAQGNTLATPNAADYTVSGNDVDNSGYINGSDVWRQDGTQDTSPTTKEIYFDIKVVSIPQEGNVVIPFNVAASTLHSQYIGALSTQLSQTIRLKATIDYTLYFDLNGGSGETPKSQLLNAGSLAQKVTNPIREGYDFVGWNTQKDGKGTTWDFTTSTMTETDVTLYAQWKMNDKKVLPVNAKAPKTPKTGDMANAFAFSIALIGAGAILLSVSRKRKYS